MSLSDGEAGCDLPLASALPGLADVLPHRVVEWERTAQREELGRASAAHSDLQRCVFTDARETKWRLIDASLAFWESGGGLVAAAYGVETPDGMDWSGFASVVGDDDTGVCQQAREAFEPLARAAARDLEQVPLHERSVHEAAAPAAGEQDPRAILWSHPTVCVELPDGTGLDVRSHVASAIVPDRCELELRGAHDALCRIGLSACVVHGRAGGGVAAALTRLIGVHTAIWGQAMVRDLRLTEKVSQVSVADGSWTRHDLEREALEALSFYEDVRAFRARITNVSVHLRPLDRDIWEGLHDAWGLSAQLETVDARLEDLQRIHRDLTTALSATQARRLDHLVLAFSAISLVSLGVSVAAFVQKPLQSLDLGAFGVVVAFVAGALLVAALFIRVVGQPLRRGAGSEARRGDRE